jgi:hypothetical protein
MGVGEEERAGVKRRLLRETKRGGLVLVAGLVVAACGAGAPRVIGPGVRSTSSIPPSSSSAPPTNAGASPTTTTAPSAPSGADQSLTPAQVSQIDQELGVIGDSLNESASALANPNKGDEGP